MSKQIAVRLPEDMVEFIDETVRNGRGRSRAEVVLRALSRERRRAAAERDAEILAAAPDQDDDLGGLADHLSHQPTPVD